MKKRFTEEQIIDILKEAEAGMKVSELCGKHGISDARYYNWTACKGYIGSHQPICGGATPVPSARMKIRPPGAMLLLLPFV